MTDMTPDATTLPELDDAALALLFTDAHSHNHWQDRDVPDAVLQKAVSMAELGPTAFNQQPMRLILVRSEEAKTRLDPAMSEGNRAKTHSAPVTAIVCYDIAFYENLPEVFPGYDAKSHYDTNAAVARANAVRNGTLQAGYLILAARAVGLDCGPMSGFDAAKVKELFLEGRTWEVNFILNLGYGVAGKTHPRNPRLGFGRITETV